MAKRSVVLQIRVDDPAFVSSIKQGELNDAEHQISVSLSQQIPKEAATGLEPVLLTVVVSFATSLTAGLLANWLYDRFRSKATEMRIDGERVKIEVTLIAERISIHFDSNDSPATDD